MSIIKKFEIDGQQVAFKAFEADRALGAECEDGC